MKDILSDDAAPALQRVGRERPLLAFDFDGTLAPFVDEPALATIPPATRTLLRLVALMYPCAVVSGRARGDVLSRVDGIPLLAVVGNHGAEAGHGPVDRSPRPQVAGWAAALRRELSHVDGVMIEDKGLSVAIHYRRARARGEAQRAVMAAARGLPGTRAFVGRAVVNVVPADAVDKGEAITRLLARTGARSAVYVGDDATDEAAFRNARVEVAVRVGRTHISAAEYYLPSQPDVDAFLRALARARLDQDGRGDRVADLERTILMLEAVRQRVR